MKNTNIAIPIPVVMYHTVGRIIPDWKWSFLTVPVKIFEDHLMWLKRSGYQTVSLGDLYLHVAGEHVLPPKSVVLTFDDGYLDNWIYAAPLLKKYGCKGTVFVNPDFIDPEEKTPRPTLEDVWAGKCQEEDLPVRGFMSWKELALLTEYGPLEVEAHAMTHTWYPSGPEIIDFHHPDDGYFWLDWNAFPDKKPFYLLDPQKSRVAYGAPIYEHQKSLACKRFFPDPEVEKILCSFVQENGGNSFFAKEGWREKLQNKAHDIRKNFQNCGRFESENEQFDRFQHELVDCRDILQTRLGEKIEFLCWPGGGYSEATRALALEYYKSVTLSSADPSPFRNRPGESPQLIKRLGVPGISLNGRMLYYRGRYFLQALKEYQGSMLARRYRQLQKVFFLGKERLGRI